MHPSRIVVTILATSSLCVASEKKVALEKLPPAVQQAVKELAKTSTLIGITQETENGAVTYEVETKVDGRTRDVNVGANGAVVLLEEEMPLDQVPAPARGAIEKKAAGAKIARVEKVTKGKRVTYEAHIRKRGHRSEFVVAPDGTPTK